MDLHTGTVAMYMPWNYKDESVADEQASKDMNTLLESVVSAKYESGKSIWDGSAAGVPSREPDVGIGSEVSYLASGTASDFMQSKGVKYTFSAQLLVPSWTPSPPHPTPPHPLPTHPTPPHPHRC